MAKVGAPNVFEVPEDQRVLGTPACPSLGSIGHSSNLCLKPCAYVFKGCKNGAQCQFCHLCNTKRSKDMEDGKRQRRKQERHPLQCLQSTDMPITARHPATARM